MKNLRPAHVLLVLVLAGALGLVLAEGRHPRDDPAGVLRALRAAQGPQLPAASRAGATSVTEPDRYDRDRLYQLVDGAAEAYLARGFQACVAATYAFAVPAGQLEVAAEAHRFESEGGARAQAEAERPSGAAELPGLPGATSDGAVLLAVAGRDLLKLTSLSLDPRGPEALRALAATWRKEMEP